ncbi:MAG: iron-containing alcohol dehydrogenase [Clostridia bacterium]|nr:iron-containing alcohol dehydrogenase [Clostridia bacterium]
MKIYDTLSSKYVGRDIGCPCGRVHRARVKDVIIGDGAVGALPGAAAGLGAARAFVVSDRNTERAAGGRVSRVLDAAGIRFDKFVFEEDRVEPDEASAAAAVAAFGGQDIVIGVGSGVINDICKLLAKTAGKPFIIVATAPSMDGYCSSTSAMLVGGLKRSLDSRCADVFIGDTDILKDCPDILKRAGFGDMIAKITALYEWRLGSLITGEYYCPFVEETVRTAWKRILDGAGRLMSGDPEAVAAVTDGLVISGIAMDHAGLSRPASGCEHYFSHLWDMRGAAFGTPTSLHGIQCAVGTVMTLKGYEKLFAKTPDFKAAAAYKAAFPLEEWFDVIRERVGIGGETMVRNARSGNLYDPESSAERLRIIEENYESIVSLAKELLIPSEEAVRLLKSIGCPVSMAEIGLPANEANIDFEMTRDVRDKYILSSLAWDTGVKIDLIH